jgi:hypothetical protein
MQRAFQKSPGLAPGLFMAELFVQTDGSQKIGFVSQR